MQLTLLEKEQYEKTTKIRKKSNKSITSNNDVVDAIIAEVQNTNTHNEPKRTTDANYDKIENTVIDHKTPANDLDNNIQKEYTVSEISYELRKTVESKFGSVRVKGEISGLKIATSGHAYFNLKDNDAVISCTCWKPVLSAVKIAIEDGMEVIISGKITTFAGQSKYQINVEYIQHTGIGALMQILEERKKKLAAQGIFDISRKKTLPMLPKKIGVITSMSGAVIKDIIHRIKERCPINLVIYPVSVQGTTAASEVSDAINEFNSLDNQNAPEIIIIARGGGSIEDLWAFNEEVVVMAAYNSRIPIISAVGHETDFTLLDFVADIRAPTPTAAAEIAVPVLTDLKFTINNYGLILRNKISSKVQHANEIISTYNNTILSNPDNFLYKYDQKLDIFTNLLIQALPNMITIKSAALQKQNISMLSMLNLVNLLQTKLYNVNLQNTFDNYYQKIYHKLTIYDKSLSRLNIQQILNMGFAILMDKNSKIIDTTQTLANTKEIDVQLKDGKTLIQIK